jgi:hypothetical protein
VASQLFPQQLHFTECALNLFFFPISLKFRTKKSVAPLRLNSTTPLPKAW